MTRRDSVPIASTISEGVLLGFWVEPSLELWKDEYGPGLETPNRSARRRRRRRRRRTPLL